MALWTPEFLQTQKYSAQRARMMMAQAGIIQEGIFDLGDFAVTQRGAGANMSVDVAAGSAWIKGDDTSRQGHYHVVNDATVNVAIPAAHATLPRLDQVVLRIYDSTIIGGGKDGAFIEVVSGTATGGATLANRTGAAALPASAIKLADVIVGAADASIVNAEIGNLRSPRAGQTGYPAAVSPLSVTGAPAQYAMGRPAAFVPAVSLRRNGSQSVATSTQTGIQFNQEEFDLLEMHDLGVNLERITARVPGVYALAGHSGWAISSAGASRTMTLRDLSGNTIQFSGHAPVSGLGHNYAHEVTTDVYLGYGDFVDLRVFQDQGSNLNLEEGRFAAHWIGP